jgi:predicted MFS family arabinose efflux permease
MGVVPDKDGGAGPSLQSGARNRELSEGRVVLLAVAAAIVTANAYYIHPIIARVAETFAVSDSLVGAVPAFNQIALALGIILLLPLGDRFSNRRLITFFLLLQVLTLLFMAMAESFWWFVAASTALGFFTITPYLLPAYASRRVGRARLGHVTAVLTAGVIAGVVLSRTASGVVGEYLGWRVIYWIAAALMLASTVALRWLLDDEESGAERKIDESYGGLILSLLRLVPRHPEVLLSGFIQGLSFGIFLLVWMGLGLHLTSPEMGLGVDDVGYLGVFSALNVFTTPLLGKWADRVGPRRARVVVAVIQFLGIALLFVTGHSFWLLAIPIVIMSVAGPMIDVTGRMTALGEAPDIRTRLMSLYISTMFLGGGVGSWAGTIAYDLGGWNLTSGLALGLSFLILLLSLMISRWHTRVAPPIHPL